ncbi:MAG: DUF1036 domain-containing protein [Micropepsaceae bacterium]
MPFLRVLLFSVFAVLLAAAPAQAKFRLCNKTDHPMAAAIGFYKGKVWVSEGWWRVEPKSCMDILRGALQARYYYLRGVHLGVDGAWDGNRYFCVAADNFTIKGRKNCSKRGFGQAGFFEIDTGDYTTWVQNLSD